MFKVGDTFDNNNGVTYLIMAGGMKRALLVNMLLSSNINLAKQKEPS